MKALSNIDKPVVLLILDGWGLSPSWRGNAIAMSNPPFINQLWKKYPHLVLKTTGIWETKRGKIANSEIGHATIGAGRFLPQDIDLINEAIKNGEFAKNKVLSFALNYVSQKHSSLHLIGLLSDGGVHSAMEHLFALLDLAKQHHIFRVYLHGILDGVDVPSTSSLIYLSRLIAKMNSLGVGQISTLCGRFFAMDRDGNWDRVARAYLAMVQGKGYQATSVLDAVSQYHQKGLEDSVIPPTIFPLDLKGKTLPSQFIHDDDVVIFFNFRADRARQLSRALASKFFRPRWCLKKPQIVFVTFTEYQPGLTKWVVFPREPVKNSLPEVISRQRLKQLRVAESEKYVHISYFFNGWQEGPFWGEDRVIIPSDKVDAFEKKPQMQAEEIARVISEKIKKYDLIVANIANVDMLAHTGNIDALSVAIEATDQAVEKITQAALKAKGTLIITADHGNGEEMIHWEKGKQETFHSINPVPFLFINARYLNKEETPVTELKAKGLLKDIMVSQYSLADIAPTILALFGIKKPKEMTGQSLLQYL